MLKLARNLFHFEARETTGDLIVYRAFELFIIAFTIKFCWTWGLYSQKLSTVILPLGIANYVNVSFMFDNGISVLVALAATVLCLFGFFRAGSRYAYLAALVLFHLEYVARYSQGEISHGSNFVGMGLLALAMGAIFFEDNTLRRKFSLGTVYFFIGLGYTLAGICKLVGTGPHWADGRHLWLWLGERQVDVLSAVGTFQLNGLQELILSYAPLGSLILTFGLLVELCGVLVWFRRTRYVITPLLIGMHLGIAVSMNLFFGEFTYELLIIGLPWPYIINRILERLPATDRLHLNHSRLLSA